MRAVVVDHETSERLVLRQVDAPVPKSNEAIVRVASISLNRGETRDSILSAKSGYRPGWDFAGIVEQVAADGSGPQLGVRVVGILRSGAWAEKVAVDTRSLAELPASVSFAQAATLPIAGLTAYHALRRGGLALNKSILITGATGGVGDFAVRLAHLSGARVTAHIRHAEWEEKIRQAGADHVAVGESLAECAAPFGPFDLIVESVGGQTLKDALTLLGREGTAVTLGLSAVEPIVFEAGKRFLIARTLYGLSVYHELEYVESASIGLRRLADLVALGKLSPWISRQAPWTEIGIVARDLLNRRYPGKAVLRLMADE